MNDEYKQLECISKMKQNYFERFCAIVEEYRGKLSDNIVIENSAFTLHDFDHHCFDIYKIISKVLFDGDLIYRQDYGLSDRELYILNLAVLFHDIGMSNGLDRTRDNHPIHSAEYIEREYSSSKSILRKESDLSLNEIKILKAIIIAHGTINDMKYQKENSGIKASKLQDNEDRIGGKIRPRFLAGVLRLADELDVSVERIGTGELEQEMEELEQKFNRLKNKQNRSEAENKDLEKWKGFEKSLDFWRKLHLISVVKRKEDDNKRILLVVDDDYVQRKLDESQNEATITRQLVEIYNKINKEFKEIVEVCFSGNKLGNYVPVKELIIVTEVESIKREIDKTLDVRSLESVVEEDKKKLI